MSYQIIPNIAFIAAVLGIVLIILRHLPEAVALDDQARHNAAEQKLMRKGLPAQAVSKIKTWWNFSVKKVWNFALEAKDLKPDSVAGYRIKKMFGTKPQKPVAAAAASSDMPQEKDFLQAIKNNPKNLANYEALAKFYYDGENFADAKDVYGYLLKHQPASSDWHGRLAYCYYQLKDFTRAAEHYRISLGLDSTQPTRYYNLGLCLEAAGHAGEAEEAFSHAIALEPANVKFYISLSNAQMRRGEPEAAKQTLLKAKKLDPANAQVKIKLKNL